MVDLGVANFLLLRRFGISIIKMVQGPKDDLRNTFDVRPVIEDVCCFALSWMDKTVFLLWNFFPNCFIQIKKIDNSTHIRNYFIMRVPLRNGLFEVDKLPYL